LVATTTAKPAAFSARIASIDHGKNRMCSIAAS